MAVITELIIILACLVLSAFFSSSETAMLRLRPHDVDRDARGSSGPAVLAARDLLRQTSRLLITILLGNNLVNILGATVASALAVHYLGPEGGIFLATVVMTLTVLVFGEVLPKAIATRNPRRVAYFVSLPLYLVHQLLRPIHFAFDRFLEPVVRRAVGAREVEVSIVGEDLMEMARRSRARQPSGSPLAIMGSVARAAEMTVSDIMVPRAEIFALPVETPASELLEHMMAERYTRVPVYSADGVDHVLGVVHLKDVIELVRSGETDIHPAVKPVLRVPERKPILRLLADMQRSFMHVAIVKDEFGITMGMATQEDILEELVGEIRDEFDTEELQTIRPLPEGGYQVLGRVKVMDFNRQTGWSVEAERGDTMGGLVFNTLGRSPRKGDRLEIGGYELVVDDVSGARLSRLSVFEKGWMDKGDGRSEGAVERGDGR